MKTTNTQTIKSRKPSETTMTYQEQYGKCAEYLRFLSDGELLVFHLFWKRKLFPDEIAQCTGYSCDEVVEVIVVIARKLAPISDLIY